MLNRDPTLPWRDFLNSISESVERHEVTQSRRVSLVASANAVSDRVRKLMDTDLVNRAAEGRRGAAVFPGLEDYYRFEELAAEKITEVFHAGFAEIRPISGTQANHIVYQALTDVHDTVVVLGITDGAHVSVSGRVARDARNLKFVPLPLKSGSLLIDTELAARTIEEIKPRLVFLGGSVMIEAQPLERIVAASRTVDAPICFDASHVAGLVATGIYPNPLAEGVDLLTMTTCKTIPGPSHAWIVGCERYRERIETIVFPGHVSGGHLQESIGAAAALAEILSSSVNYGVRTVATARALGDGLIDGGVKVVRTSSGTVTDTHQVLAYVPIDMTGREAVQRLATANILANANPLPESLLRHHEALRFGTQELTWRGGTVAIARELGSLISAVLLDGARIASVARRVSEIAAQVLLKPGRLSEDLT